MKTQTGIWIDGSKAIIVDLREGKEHVSQIEAEIENRIHHFDEGQKGSFMGGAHINHEKTFDERKKHQIDDYLKDVMNKVSQSDEIYIFGPGEIKSVLNKHFQENHLLASKVKSVDTADSMTDNQIIAKVVDFYSDAKHL